MSLDKKQVEEYVKERWAPDGEIEKTLCDFIKVANMSPLFDPEWETNGLQEQACDILTKWVTAQNVPGLTMEVIKHPGRTPLIFIEVEAVGAVDGVILQYAHADKQPPLGDWTIGAPTEPVIKEEGGQRWLFGRGGADDGYGIFAAITALMALKKQGCAHARNVILVEFSEESGSPDLPYYVEQLKERIGAVDLVVCLDSGCGDYEHLWMTTSLRGMVAGELRVQVAREGTHSGLASGIVPSTFRIVRKILGRIEDVDTGEITVPELKAPVPEGRVREAGVAAGVIGEEIHRAFPFAEGVRPVTDDLSELLLNRTWRAALEVTGADGIPHTSIAGNVMRPFTTFTLSMRLPPTVDGPTAAKALEDKLNAEAPYGAKVTFKAKKNCTGWNAPVSPQWLTDAAESASQSFFGKPAMYFGEGGSIPFMGQLGVAYPKASFMVTGVLGKGSNAHSINEKLSMTMATKLAGCVAAVVDAHAKKNKRARDE